MAFCHLFWYTGWGAGSFFRSGIWNRMDLQMKKKKLLSGVLALLILITALSGCGKTGKVSDADKRPVIK